MIPDRGPDIRTIAAMLADKAEAVCRDLLPQGFKEGIRWRCGDVLGARGQSLSVLIGGPRQGQWRDFSSDQGGDLIDLIAANQRITKGEALAWAKRWLGIPVVAPGARDDRLRPSVRRHEEERARVRAAKRQQATTVEEAKKRESAIGIWSACVRAEGTVVESYLRGRGIDLSARLPMPAAIRLAPLLTHAPSGRQLPAMVAAIFAPVQEAGSARPIPRIVAVHRTWLEVPDLARWNFPLHHHVLELGDTASATKLNHGQAKMVLGSFRAGCIPLTPAPTRATLAICEGIETGLSVAELNPDWSVWAAVSVSNMAAIRIPTAVRCLKFCADNDSKPSRNVDGTVRVAGDGQPVTPANDAVRRAAHLARDLAADAGRALEVEIVWPPAGMDFNDVLRAQKGLRPARGHDAAHDAGVDMRARAAAGWRGSAIGVAHGANG